MGTDYRRYYNRGFTCGFIEKEYLDFHNEYSYQMNRYVPIFEICMDVYRALRDAGAAEIYSDSFTGTKLDRPQFKILFSQLKEGDTLIVTKLDRIARSMTEGSRLIADLIDRKIVINILNIGVMDNTPSSRLIRNIFFAFAEFERDMIV